MNLVTYTEQEAQHCYYDTRYSTVGIMSERVQAVEKCAGKEGVGNTMQQLVYSYNLGQFNKITGLVG
jgi:hypothetical protein